MSLLRRFLDEIKSASAVYSLAKRSKFFESLKSFKALVENQSKKWMYALRLDRAGKITSSYINSLLQSQCMKL